jgi:hypothetical protein
MHTSACVPVPWVTVGSMKPHSVGRDVRLQTTLDMAVS